MFKSRREFLRSAAVAAPAAALLPGAAAARGAAADSRPDQPPAGPLPSWNDGPTRRALLDFVARTTTPGGPDFIPPAGRIAAFDNDGTLWCEQPMYVQAAFALDRLRELAPAHPEWKDREPYRSALAGDLAGLLKTGLKGVAEVVMATHAGTTADEFAAIAKAWLAAARHPRFGRAYTECVYAPMLELLAFLRSAGYATYIVSGGGVEMIRAFAEETYGIPPGQVVGSTIKAKYELRDGKPAIVRLPELDFIDDGPGKPVAIHKFIGRRPVLAVGNSDGDFEMLEWTTAGPGPRLGLLLHHTDADREYAYDRTSSFGRLSRALDEAPRRGWLVADMKADFRRVFAFE
ncbi:HAD family hydrolase [Aquisphaera insulae]|uniref:HAD family hydrolase n=1 Tax=Aquisphaera insulae TaxID=2712864 RepID=UPI0013EAA98C|nr:HAD family hydrolase [Aquisphaera insulae]